MSKLAIMLELERRGKLPDDRQALLNEARKRGLIPQLETSQEELVNPDRSFLQQASGATQNLLQGASFGLADEARGALRGLGYGIGAGITGREPIMQAAQRGYREGTDIARQEEQQFAQEMPKTALAANIAGGFANPLNKVGGRFIGGGATMAGKLARGVGVGAGMGAGYGAGSAVEDERLGGAIGGATAGGAVSGMLGLAGAGLGAVGKKIKSPSIYDVLAKRLQQDNLTPEQLKAKLAVAGNEAIIPDVAGANVRSLALGLKTEKGETANLAEKLLTQRQENQANRIYEAGKKLMGGVGKSAYETSKQLAEIKRVESQPLYEHAYKKNIPLKRINHLLDRPPMKKAMKKAVEFIKTETGQDIDVSQFVDKRRGINTRFVDYIKRGLDDTITQSKTPLGDSTNETRIVTNLKNTFLDIVDEINPDYKKAREVFAGYAEMGDALDLGKQFLKGDTNEIAYMVKQMNPSEKQMFVEGVLNTFQEKLGQSREGVNKASQILTPNKLKALKTAFPNDTAYNKFVETIKFEDTMAKTRNSILGGSNTWDKKIATEGVVDEISGDIITKIASGNIKGAIGSGIKNTLKSMFGEINNIPQKQRDELGKLLFSQNQQDVNQALDILAKDLPQKLSRNNRIELLRRMFALSVSGQTGSKFMERE